VIALTKQGYEARGDTLETKADAERAQVLDAIHTLGQATAADVVAETGLPQLNRPPPRPTALRRKHRQPQRRRQTRRPIRVSSFRLRLYWEKRIRWPLLAARPLVRSPLKMAAQALRLRAIRYPTSRFHRLSSPLLDRRYAAWLSEADVGRLLPVCCPGLACRSRLASSGQSLWGPVGGKDGKGSAPLWFGARSAWHRCRPWQAGKRAKSRGFLPRCSSSCVRACPRRALLVLRGRRRRRLEPPGACPS
jgi:hypothetical protein